MQPQKGTEDQCPACACPKSGNCRGYSVRKGIQYKPCEKVNMSKEKIHMWIDGLICDSVVFCAF